MKYLFKVFFISFITGVKNSITLKLQTYNSLTIFKNSQYINILQFRQHKTFNTNLF